MSTFEAVKEAIEEQGKTFDAYTKTNDERLKALENNDESLAAELGEKMEKIEKDLQGASKLKTALEKEIEYNRERIEDLEARASSPGKTAVEKMRDDYKDTFVRWIRSRGESPDDAKQLKDLHRKMLDAKDVTIGDGPSGGFAVPEIIAREIERLEKKFSPVRDLVKVVQAGSSDYKELVNIRGSNGGWVGETDTRTGTDTSKLRERQPTHGELYAYPTVSEWSLDDIFFNVEEWLAEDIADAFAINEAEAVIRGNGTNKPTGMLNTAPTADPDFASPLRNANAYQFIACAAQGSPAVLGVSFDCLINLVYALNSRYRAGATFTMNSNTTGAVRRLKDADGQYLWQPSLQAGQPDMLLGYSISTWEQMDDIGANNHPIGFGNYRRGYVLADRVGMRMTRDEVTQVGFVKFYTRRREGGIVLNNDAIKFLKTTP